VSSQASSGILRINLGGGSFGSDKGAVIVSGRKRKPSSGPYLTDVELRRDRIPDPVQFPFCLPSIRALETNLPLHPKVTFFVGENGTGKSTLIEAIAVSYGLNPEGGSRNFLHSTRASHTNLDEALQVAKAPRSPADSYFLRAESFFTLATEIERLDNAGGGPPIIDSYGGRSLHEQSHGESFFALFKNRFRDQGLYLMDEPEAALSPRRQLEFLALMHDFCKDGSQFLIATHSPIIMAYPDAWIYVLSQEGIRRVPYMETDHYLVSRGFLSNPKRSLDVLMADEGRAELAPECQNS
jgi:predicted ATPase